MSFAKQQINDYLPKTKSLDLSMLPHWQASIITLMSQALEAPQSAILNNLNSVCARVAQINRAKVHIRAENTIVPSNYYGITFMPSGDSKDKTTRYLNNNCFKDVLRLLEIKNEDTYNAWVEQIEREADLNCKSEKAKMQYIKENTPRNIVSVIGDATYEAFLEARKTLKKANYNSTYVYISEFGNYISTGNTSRDELITSLVEAYDFGDTQAKIIKSEKIAINLYSIPSIFFAHSSLSGLRNESYKEKLLNILDSGLARRAYICFPDRNETPKLTINSLEEYREKISKTQKAIEQLQAWNDFFLQVYHKTKTGSTFTITEEAYNKFIAYKLYNSEIAEKFNPYDNEGLRSEAKNRFWKALKLAGIYACISHPDQKTVEKEDMLQAIYVTEFFGRYYTKFYKQENITDSEKLLGFFIENLGKLITKSQIRKQRFVHKDKFSNWFSENFDEAVILAEKQGYKLEIIRGSGNSQKFVLNKIEFQDPAPAKMAVSHEKSENYIPVDVNFDDLYKIALSDYNYTGNQYHNNYRNQQNWTGCCNILILDFDENVTIEQARTYFEDYTYLLATTRNHQKVKGSNPACDRFRVFLPLKESFEGSIQEYKQTFKAIDDYLSGGKSDQKAIEPARFYFGYPGAVYFYNKTHKLLDWKAFYEKEPEIISPAKETQKHTSTSQAMSSFVSHNKVTTITGFKKLEDILGTSQADKAFKVDEIHPGNRNNELHRLITWMRDEGIPSIKIKNEILRINSLPNINLPERELNTLF